MFRNVSYLERLHNSLLLHDWPLYKLGQSLQYLSYIQPEKQEKSFSDILDPEAADFFVFTFHDILHWISFRLIFQSPFLNL